MSEEALPQEWDATPEPGWIAPALDGELPGLSLLSTTVGRGSGRSPKSVKDELRILSSRITGAGVIQMRQQPVPWAYRVFFRHIGLDPDTTRTPVEQLAFERISKGGFPSRNLLDDAITLATMDTAVPVVAFDADRVGGRFGIRQSAPGEGFEGRSSPLPTGTLVVVDDQRPVQVLFGDIAADRGVTPKTTRTALIAIGVKGVPAISLEEALWRVCSAMRA